MHNLYREIVGGAALLGQSNQLFAGGLRRALAGDVINLPLAQGAIKPVAALDNQIVSAEFEADVVWANQWILAEAAGEHRSKPAAGGLVDGDQPQLQRNAGLGKSPGGA